MSAYEQYDERARNYDATRGPVGLEILLGCFARSPAALSRAVILDAGCGTGNYALSLLPYVERIEAVDASQGMLDRARVKANARPDDALRFQRASIDQLPFEAGTFDGIMVNQVLHHLDDDAQHTAHRRTLRELARVLKPGGVLVISTCSQEQVRRGWWYCALIPEAVEKLCNRYLPLEILGGLLDEAALTHRGNIVPVDARWQGAADRLGPLRKEFRDGDSIWTLASDAEIARACDRIRELDASGELERFVRDKDAVRQRIGQITFVHAVGGG